MTKISKQVYKDRLHSLFDVMKTKNLDALIITHDDEYLSYELSDDCQRILYVCGFSGSAANLVIIKNINETKKNHEPLINKQTQEQYTELKACALFTDGRYLVQAKEQIDTDIYSIINRSELNECEFLIHKLPRQARVGIDLTTISYEQYLEFKKALKTAEIHLIGYDGSLVDLIWDDRPKAPCSAVQIYPDEYNGLPSLVKRQNLASSLRKNNIDATIISSPQNICWLLNIRGRDKASLPVINSRLVAYSNEAIEWYVDEERFNDDILDDLEEHYGHIDIFPPDRFDDLLERLNSSKCTVYVDPKATNAKIIGILLEGATKLIQGLDLCELPKAKKNYLEIAGMHKAHLKDGVAMCRFLAWLDDVTQVDNIVDLDSYIKKVEDIDEAKLSERAESFRKVEGDYIEPSFDTISAIGANAAMCHYNFKESNTPKKLGVDPIYLIDSGAHYLEGTTDITRTVLVGPNLDDEIKRMYTLVLKAHISLTTTIFPRGTSGLQLDAIARRPLWDYGFDYQHGTGHGVGHVLSVHEGPQGISTKYSQVPLEEGMVLSIEPGFYKENHYGIRLENLVVVEKCTMQGCKHMLCFVPLTAVPFDKRLIVREMLTTKEREWLNNYHSHVNSLVKSASSTLSDFEVNWLNQATAEI